MSVPDSQGIRRLEDLRIGLEHARVARAHLDVKRVEEMTRHNELVRAIGEELAKVTRRRALLKKRRCRLVRALARRGVPRQDVAAAAGLTTAAIGLIVNG